MPSTSEGPTRRLLSLRVREYHRHFGAVLALMAERPGLAVVQCLSGFSSPGVYRVNDAGLFMKYSTFRGPTWKFAFTNEERLDIERLWARFRERTFVLLLCYDAVCVLTYAELLGRGTGTAAPRSRFR